MRDYRLQSVRVVIAIAFSIVLSTPSYTKAQDPSPASPPAPQQKDDQPLKAESSPENAPNRQQPTKETIKISTNMVQLDVMVIDKFNQPVLNLLKHDFTVYDDKSQQSIESVNVEEVPISIGFIVDTSESMRNKIQTVIDSAVTLVNQMRQSDEAFVVQFKSKPSLVQEFTGDKSKLEGALRTLNPSGGTSLLDALIAASKFATEYGKQRRKALIIISDGLERNSGTKEREVLEAIKENEVQVYVVGLLDQDSESFFLYKSPIKKAKELITRLTVDSGGRAFFPDDISEMPSISAQILKDLRTQYVVSYYPKSEKRDGNFHTIRVVINQKDKHNRLSARTRQGYYSK